MSGKLPLRPSVSGMVNDGDWFLFYWRYSGILINFTTTHCDI